MTLLAREQLTPPFAPAVPAEQMDRVQAKRDYAARSFKRVTDFLRRTGYRPSEPYEVLMAADSLAHEGDDAARAHIDLLRTSYPVEAECVLARLLYQQRKDREAAEALERAFVAYRSDPWPDPDILHAALDLAVEVSSSDASGAAGRALFETLETPFSLYLCNDKRLESRYRIARAAERGSYGEMTLEAVRMFEPNPLWTEEFLETRLGVYSALDDAHLRDAQDDVLHFRRNALRPFGKGTLPPTS
jgi:spermidine synthase